MGKRKVDMKKIQDRQALQVTFSKRKKGLFKKAQELCILTGVNLLVVAFSPAGKPFSFGDMGLIHRYLQGQTNMIPKTVEDEHFCVDKIDLEQCSVVANREEQEANAAKAASEEHLTECHQTQHLLLDIETLMANDEEGISPESEVDGVALTQRVHELEMSLIASDQEGVSTASEFGRMSSSEASASEKQLTECHQTQHLLRDIETLMANDQEGISPESEVDGVALTQRVHELEMSLIASDQEGVSTASEFGGMSSSEASASSEDFFDDLPPLDVPDYCLCFET